MVAMAHDENGAGYLQVIPPAQLASMKKTFTVGQLERALSRVFLPSDACEWDRTGLLAGDPDAAITGVAVALDPTIRAFEAAEAVGANVLVTHHPLFLDPPVSFLPASVQGANAGSRVHHVLAHGMSCLSFHTACDVSEQALGVLPAMLRLEPLHPLDPLPDQPKKGFGMVCQPAEGSLSLQHLASRCVSVFKSMPRVWGDPQTSISRVCTFGGSAGSALELCDREAIDCLVCGEVRYHDALDAFESGLCIIELGHDVSELPLCALLAGEVIAAGIPESSITIIDQSGNWHIPESVRR